MSSFEVDFPFGILRKRGKRQAGGGLLAARNARYLSGNLRWLWMLLGRSVFNATPIPASGGTPPVDAGEIKTIFPIHFDGFEDKIVVHSDKALFEATTGATGSFSQVLVNGTDYLTNDLAHPTPRGIPCAYRGDTQQTVWLYPIGNQEWDTRRLVVRTKNLGWKTGGHRTPLATFTAVPAGSGSFASTTPVRYTYRIYDQNTDTVSLHHPVIIEVAPFSAKLQVTLQWSSGIGLTTARERGTHIRIYRTLLNETPGIYYEVTPRMIGYVAGKGIPLTVTVPGFSVTDSATNTQAQLAGTVRADGQEGTVAWAEHGGEPPAAGGCIPFDGCVVYFGIWDRPQDILYSAVGYPEVIPCDFDGNYAYYLTMDSPQDDKVLRCTLAGDYLLVLCKNAIFRVASLPTFADPGFSRRIQDRLTDRVGIVGPYAAGHFGVGEEQSKYTVYLSRTLGLMLTDGVNNTEVVSAVDFLSLVEPAYLGNAVIENYTKFKELWVFYTPKGGTQNTKAMILDYSSMEEVGMRATGPVDVKGVAACEATGADGVTRFYIVGPTERTVYVQDSGAIDAQKNTNAAGDIVYEVDTTRTVTRTQRETLQVHRGVLYGQSGAERELTVRHYTFDGSEQQEVQEKVRVGPGETSDVFAVETAGQGFRERLTYQGPAGTTYDQEDAGCALALDSIGYEYSGQGPVGKTR